MMQPVARLLFPSSLAAFHPLLLLEVPTNALMGPPTLPLAPNLNSNPVPSPPARSRCGWEPCISRREKTNPLDCAQEENGWNSALLACSSVPAKVASSLRSPLQHTESKGTCPHVPTGCTGAQTGCRSPKPHQQPPHSQDIHSYLLSVLLQSPAAPFSFLHFQQCRGRL